MVNTQPGDLGLSGTPFQTSGTEQILANELRLGDPAFAVDWRTFKVSEASTVAPGEGYLPELIIQNSKAKVCPEEGYGEACPESGEVKKDTNHTDPSQGIDVERIAGPMASFLVPLGLGVSADLKNNTITISDPEMQLPAMQLRFQPNGSVAIFAESKGQWQELFGGNSLPQQGNEKGVQETSTPSISPTLAQRLLLQQIINTLLPGSWAPRPATYGNDRNRPPVAPAAAPPAFQTPFDQLLQQLQIKQPQ